jgi:predicted unusual protein kinase regulating ubiquinone biosynthesis (AarF/ABC1/UbiB family)
VRLGFLPDGEDPAPIAAALEAALPDVLNASVSELNFKNVIDRLGDVMYEYPFTLPPYYTAVIRCLGVLEGVALQVYELTDEPSILAYRLYLLHWLY